MSSGVVTKAIKTISGGLDSFVTRHPILTGGMVLTVAIPVVLLVFDHLNWTPSEGIITQFIASTGLVLVAVLPLYYSNRKKHSATAEDIREIKHEVKNDHTTNLRVESDERHTENIRRFEQQDQMNQRILSAIEAVGADVRGLREEGGRQDDRIFRIEQAVFPPIIPGTIAKETP